MTISSVVEFAWFFKVPEFALNNAIRSIQQYELLLYITTVTTQNELCRGWDDEWCLVLTGSGEVGYIPTAFLDKFLE